MTTLSPDQQLLADHMSATTAAFQCLILLLQRNGTLERGEFQDALRDYMEMAKDQHSDVALALLHDIRQSLLD